MKTGGVANIGEFGKKVSPNIIILNCYLFIVVLSAHNGVLLVFVVYGGCGGSKGIEGEISTEPVWVHVSISP